MATRTDATHTAIAMRDLQGAKEAYAGDDRELSKSAHQTKVSQNEKHSSAGEHIKSVVFGGLDGIITTFAVVSGASGGGFGIEVILVLGFSNIFADALSMGLGDALSTKAEHEMILSERRREAWEFANYPEGEIQEMIDIYVQKKNMKPKDAEAVIKLLAKYDDVFIDQMMMDELDMQVPGPDENPWEDGFVTFCSFIFFGVFPLLGYCIFGGFNFEKRVMFGIACCFAAVMLFALGAIKSQFTIQTWYASGFEILSMGGLTAAVSFFIGWMVEEIVQGKGGGLH